MPGGGHLERAALQVRRDHPEGLPAPDILMALDGRDLAMTTVLTVLGRLRREHLVTPHDDARPHRYFAAVTREDYVADILLDALGQATGRRAALVRFPGGVSVTLAGPVSGAVRVTDQSWP